VHIRRISRITFSKCQKSKVKVQKSKYKSQKSKDWKAWKVIFRLLIYCSRDNGSPWPHFINFCYIVADSFIGGGNQRTLSLLDNHRPAANHWQTLSHNVVSEYTSPWTGFELTTLVVIGTDWTGSCKSNYHMITTTTVPNPISIIS
jgi:hypothetical protein